MPLIIGTAGHIDHGKTALVRALTGQETDRLPEEKARGISIDLGFAYFQSRAGVRVGVVDVPGHERLVKNMLAGAHGIDLVLFTVAGDDGVMPQTEEHLDILHLLGVRRGVFVITKTDLVDAARVTAVREEIAILTLGTTLEGVAVVPVSSVTGAGLTELRDLIETELAAADRPVRTGGFRLPVDRAFVVRGYGVVVTGTAIGGEIRVGATVRILPGDIEARVRGLEVHGTAVTAAVHGQRVALNLAGVDRARVRRGQVVCEERAAGVSTRFDAWLDIRPGARRGLAHHGRVRVHLGTAEVLGKVVLLDGGAVLAPGAAGWVQVVLRHPTVVMRGDRFVVREETGRWTLGGGEIVHPNAERHRVSDARVLEQLDLLRGSDVIEAAGAFLDLTAAFATVGSTLIGQLDLPDDSSAAIAAAPTIVRIAPDAHGPVLYTTAIKWDRMRADLCACVAALHTTHPLAPGIEMEQLRSEVASEVSPRVFRWCLDRLIESGSLARDGTLVRLPSHEVALGTEREKLAHHVERLIDEGHLTPPDLRQIAEQTQVDRKALGSVLAVLERTGRVVRIAPDLFYSPRAVDEAVGRLRGYCQDHGAVTAAAFRDLLGASRKFAIAFLEWCDRTGVTLRVGDVRKLRR